MRFLLLLLLLLHGGWGDNLFLTPISKFFEKQNPQQVLEAAKEVGVGVDLNRTDGKGEKNLTRHEDPIQKQIEDLREELEKNEFYLNYKNYLTYQELRKKVERLQILAKRNKKYREEFKNMEARLNALTPQSDLFKALIKIRPLPHPPTITNPFQIFELLGYKKQLKELLQQNRNYYSQFVSTYHKLQLLKSLEEEKGRKDPELNQAIKDFELVDEIYRSKLDEIEGQGEGYLQQADKEIEYQISKLVNLGIAIGITLIIFFFIKLLIKRYVRDESAYILNKLLNFVNISVIFILVFANYMENTSSLITFLGFASAGIAIAMKDWFMNMFGWIVIMVSGNFKVGDRIKIYLQNGNVQIVGDVIDITLNRIVIYEDVTYTAYRRIRRAGRIVFIPNNVVFNNPIFNYTHHGLQTVWDGIDIVVTFDSNIEKAEKIAKEVATTYSRTFVEGTRKRIEKLRLEYNIKIRSLEPRVFTFIEEYGVKISVWYLAPYSPMRTRSKISKEILARYRQESDIKIAYPTYTTRLDLERTPPPELPALPEPPRFSDLPS